MSKSNEGLYFQDHGDFSIKVGRVNKPGVFSVFDRHALKVEFNNQQQKPLKLSLTFFDEDNRIIATHTNTFSGEEPTLSNKFTLPDKDKYSLGYTVLDLNDQVVGSGSTQEFSVTMDDSEFDGVVFPTVTY